MPGSFGSDVNHYPNGTEICNRTCYDVMCAKDAEDFHQCKFHDFLFALIAKGPKIRVQYVVCSLGALNDERVAAIMPWNWGG